MQTGDLVRYSYVLSVPTVDNKKFETLGVVVRDGITHTLVLLNGQSQPTFVIQKHLEVVSHASR